MKKPAPKQRNPIARQVRSLAFRKRIVRSVKTYQRKARGTTRPDDTD